MRTITLLLFYVGAASMHERFQALRKRVKELTGLLPICNGCKRIRDDYGAWSEVDEYLEEHADVSIENKLCPDCARRMSAGVLRVATPPPIQPT